MEEAPHDSAAADVAQDNAATQSNPTDKRRFKAFIRDKLRRWRDRAAQDEDSRIPELDNALFEESDELVRFPSSLSAVHRRIVHATALALDLFHASTGEGDQRAVVVSRTGEFEAANVVPTAAANVWYNSAVSKQKLTARYFEMMNDEQHVARVRTYTEEIHAIVTEPFAKDDFQDVSWMINVPDDLSGIPHLDHKDCIIVDTLDSLRDLVAELDTTTEFAFDLEMHNHRSYYGLTCTLQISANLKDYLVDTIKLWEHIPLLAPAFADGSKIKVGHAMGGGDVPALFRDFGIVIVNGVDTQEMAAALGDKQIGLAALLDRYGCKIANELRITKSVMQVMDWRMRPFTNDMVAYACGDVHYLLPLYAIMKKSILTMSEAVEIGLGSLVDTLHEERASPEPEPERGNTAASSHADGETDVVDAAAAELPPGLDDHEDDEFADDTFVGLDDMDGAMGDLDLGDDEEDDDEAMWDGWGLTDDARVSAADVAATAEPGDELEEDDPELIAPVLTRVVSRPRDDSFSSHVSQPARAPHSATTPVVTPLGLDSYRRVCIKSAKHCLKLWAPKEVPEKAYTQVKGFTLAAKSRSWEKKHTELFKRLFVWRERLAKEHDESPVYVLSSQLMLDVARRMPLTVESLKKIQSPLPEMLQADDERYAKELVEMVQATVKLFELLKPKSVSEDHRAWWLAAAITGTAIVAAVGVIWLRARRR